MTCLRCAGDLDIFAAAAGQSIFQTRLRIEAGAVLIEARHRETGAVTHVARIWRERAGQKIDQRRLASAVRADDAKPVAAQNADRELLDDGAFVEGFGEIAGLDDEAGRSLRLARGKLHRTNGAAMFAMRSAHCFEGGEALLIALAPRGNAIAQPIFFRRDLAFDLMLPQLFLFERLIAPGLEFGEAAIAVARLAAIEPDRFA